MKVLIVAHHFPPHLSGVGNVAAEQAKHLAEGGAEVTVLTSDCSDKAASYERDGYSVHRLHALNFMETKYNAPFPIFTPLLFWKAFQLVRNTDVVHVHDSFYMSSFAAAFWARLLHKPLFVTQHIAMIPHPSKIVLAVERLVYATSGAFIFCNSSRMFVINDRVRNFLLDQGVSRDKVINITNGVDFKRFHPATPRQKIALRKKFNLPLDKPLALFIGRYVPKKGYDKLLKSGDNKYTLVFAGGNNERAHESRDKIFLGQLPQEQTAELYRACDVFILPSEGEGFPLSIQEAMASGLPIIAGRDRGYDSYKFDKKLFRLIDTTINEIKKQLTEVIHDQTLRNAMSDYSESYARSHFDWNELSLQFINAYQEYVV